MNGPARQFGAKTGSEPISFVTLSARASITSGVRESENLGGRQASRPAKSLDTFAYALTMRRRGPAQTRISAGLSLAVSVTSRACQRRPIPRVFQLLQLTLARL